MDWKFLATLIGIAAGALAFIGSWVALGFPTVATRGYVDSALRPVIYQQLRVRRHVDSVDLFQWQQNTAVTQGIEEEIDLLKAEIADLDRQIAAMER
jgi:hypothetical protein